MKPTIIVKNFSTAVTDAEVQKALAALQIQVSRDFAPHYSDAELVFKKQTDPVPSYAWMVTLLDNADQAGALGYHDFTEAGQPLGKVFVKTTIDAKSSWTVCFSHEVLEMLGDPDIIRTVFYQTGPHQGILYAYEVCDAVESDACGYEVDGVLLSDFVLPSWFETSAGVGPFSFRHNVTAPLQLAPGGYIGYWRVPNDSGWQEKFADEATSQLAKMADPRGHRHERRARRFEIAPKYEEL